MKNLTPPNAAANHEYRATTLKKIRNIFASVPEPDEKAVNIWIEAVTGTLHEYFELIWPNGLEEVYDDASLIAGLVYNHNGVLGPDGRFTRLARTVPLKAKDMHAFFKIRIDEELAIRTLDGDEKQYFSERLPIKVQCQDASGFGRRAKTSQTDWIVSPLSVIWAIDKRIEVEDGIRRLMTCEDFITGAVHDRPDFDFADFCRTFAKTYEHTDKRDLMAAVLQERIRLLGKVEYEGRAAQHLRFDLATVLSFAPRADEAKYIEANGEDEKDRGYRNPDLTPVWNAELQLAVPDHVCISPPDIFSVVVRDGAVTYVRHELGRMMQYLPASEAKTACVRQSLPKALFGA